MDIPQFDLPDPLPAVHPSKMDIDQIKMNKSIYANQ